MSSGYEDGIDLKGDRMLLLMSVELLSVEKEYLLSMIEQSVRIMEDLHETRVNDKAKECLREDLVLYSPLPMKLIEEGLPVGRMVDLVRWCKNNHSPAYSIKNLVVVMFEVGDKTNDVGKKARDLLIKENLKNLCREIKEKMAFYEAIFIVFNFASWGELKEHWLDNDKNIKVSDLLVVS